MKRASSRKTTRRGDEALAAAATEFDREFVADTFGPPSQEAQQRLDAVRRKPGRPKRGRGVQVISVSVERTLLEHIDALAEKLGISRAGAVERGLKALLAAQGEL
jgi:hypothetical protein